MVCMVFVLISFLEIRTEDPLQKGTVLYSALRPGFEFRAPAAVDGKVVEE